MSNKNKIITSSIAIFGLVIVSAIVYYPKNDDKLFAANFIKPPVIFKSPSRLRVEVDVAEETGELSDKYNVGMFWWPNNDYANRKFITENKLGAFRTNLGTGAGFSGRKSEANTYPTEDEWEKYYNYLSTVYEKPYLDAQKSGAVLGFDIADMPRWLSSRPDNEDAHPNGPWFHIWTFSPPRDYHLWSDLVNRTVRHFKDKGINNIRYTAWNEPDWMFFGSDQEYMELYKATVKGVKSVDKNIQVGGPAVSSLPHKKNLFDANGKDTGKQTDKPLIEIFIEQASKMSLPELGYDKLPIDFIDWHFPQDPEKEVAYVKGLLIKYGYNPEKTQMRIGEWISTQKGELPSTEYNAAYVVKRTNDFAENNLYHTFTSFHDQGGWSDGNWTDVGAFFGNGVPNKTTSENDNSKKFNVIKPVYNAFRALSIFAGKTENQTPNQLQVSIEENDYVTALASQTQDKKTNRILISNFIPSGIMVRDALFAESRSSMIEKKGYTEEEYELIINSIKQTAKNNQTKGKLTKDHVIKMIDQTDFPVPFNDEKVRKDIKSVLANEVDSKFKEIEYYSKNLRDIDLFVNLPAGNYTQRRYIIDKNHSSSCRYNKKTESKPSNTECGTNGEIDRKVALAMKDAETEAKKAAFLHLKSKNYTQNDINAITKVAQACKMNKKCIGTQLEKDYSKLERCRLDPKKRYITKPCPTSDTVKLELAEVYKTYAKTREQVFYYDSRNSIDKINNMKGVALESASGANISVKRASPHKEKIKMEPNSVLLIEFVSLNK